MTTANDSTFPVHLLEASPAQRYEYLCNWRVPHPNLVQAKDSLLHALRYPGDRQMIHVFGCTGVGKTTLRFWLEKLLNDEAREQLECDPDAIPVASVVTPAPDQGPFSGQLARRSASLHFARYHADSPAEFKQFASVVYAFQRHLPLREAPNLVEQSEYLYERCLGCIGILKDWLLRALAQALDDGEQTFTAKQLEACVDLRKLVAVAKEAVAGEQQVDAVDGLYTELQGLLRSATRVPTATPRSNQSSGSKKPQVKPGQRKAKRDLVAQVSVEETP